MKRPIKTPILGKLLTFGFFALASALTVFPAYGLVPVSYSQGIISGESDVLNSGTLVLARNLGAGAPAVAVNGLSFGADSGAGLTGFVHGDPGDFSNQFSSGSPLDQILSDLDFQNLGLGSSSLTLSGLTPSTDYLLQIFLSNVLNSTAKSSRVTIQGQSHNIVNFGNDANYIRAYFNASGSTEVIQFGTGSSSESARMIINAFAVTAVPEPTTLTFLGLGLACLAGFRRK